MKHIEETIKLMNYLQNNPKATQREIMNELDISLGKVNFIINSLIKTGLIKLKRFQASNKKLAYLYILTPKGIYEKALIAKSYINTKLKEYEELRVLVDDLMKDIVLEEDAEKKNK